MIIQFRRKILNAKNRKQDRVYTSLVESQFVPMAGNKVVTDFSDGLEVREVRMIVRDGKLQEPVAVTLEPDNTTFKQPEKFAERCKKVESAAGWYLEE